MPRVADVTVGLLVPAMFVCGTVGAFLAERQSFGAEWTEDQFVERLDHEHPVVAEYAARHFLRDTAPNAITTLDNYRKSQE